MSNRILQIIFLLFILSCNSKKNPSEYRENLLGIWDLKKQIIYQDGIEQIRDSIINSHWEFNKYNELVLFNKTSNTDSLSPSEIVFHKKFYIDTTDKGNTIFISWLPEEAYKIETLTKETLVLKDASQDGRKVTFELEKNKNQNLKKEMVWEKSNDPLGLELELRNKTDKVKDFGFWTQTLLMKFKEKQQKEDDKIFEDLKKKLNIGGTSLNNPMRFASTIFDCDASILKRRPVAKSSPIKKNHLFSIGYMYSMYQTQIKKTRINADEFALAFETNNLLRIKKISQDFKNILVESQNFITTIKRIIELEHLEELLYCYYQYNINYIKFSNAILDEKGTLEDKKAKIQIFFKENTDEDDKRYKELYDEFNNVYKQNELYRFEKSNNLPLFLPPVF